MAGLSVLLETQKSHHLSQKRPQILIKANMLPPPYSLPTPPPRPLSSPCTASTFLEYCFLCRKHLSHEKDIYMYRGDRAFCSVECRSKQMAMDEESVRREKFSIGSSSSSSTTSSSCSPARHRKGNKSRAAAAGGFAY